MKIRWLGQSGYELKSGKTKILIDPYLSNAVEKLSGKKRLIPPLIEPKSLRADALFCTHDHLDHLDPDAIGHITHDLRIYTTQGGAEHLRIMGKGNVVVMVPGDRVVVGNFRVTAVFAHHTIEAIGLVVEAEGKKLWFSGDTLFHDRLKDMAAWKLDYAFLCINGKLGNMNVEEAAVVAEAVNAAVSIPNHYGMFADNTEDPEIFTSNVKNSLAMELDCIYEF